MEIKYFRYVSHKTIKASFAVHIPEWSLTLNKMTLIETPNGTFVSPPSEKYEKDGETKYAPYFSFDKNAYKRFYESVLKKVNEYMAANPRQGDPMDRPPALPPLTDDDLPF